MINAHAATLGNMRESLVDELNQHESFNSGMRQGPQMVDGKIVFKAGDLIYSGEMHLSETENMLTSIINDYSGVLASSPEEFARNFGSYFPRKTS